MADVERALPSRMKGFWIWRQGRCHRGEDYLLFRRMFNLEPGFKDATLWITAHSEYHLFVNGRRVGYGPSPGGSGTTYVDRYDVAHCFEAGANVVAVKARCVDGPLLVGTSKEPGLWCQLDINGEPRISTDAQWLVAPAAAHSVPRSSRGGDFGFVERHDFTRHDSAWDSQEFSGKVGWGAPNILVSLDEMGAKLVATPFPPLVFDAVECLPVSMRGTFVSACFSTHVSFLGWQGDKAGVFSAETQLLAEKEQEIRFHLGSDTPCRFHLNGQLVGETARMDGLSARHSVRADIMGARPHIGALDGKMELKTGWNRLLVTLQRTSGSMGFILVLPTLREEGLDLRQTPDENAEKGWLVAGPLKMPYELVDGLLRLDRCSTATPFVPTMESQVDAAGLLETCRFVTEPPASASCANGTAATLLRQGEYAVFDLGRVCFGFPSFELKTDGEAVVDIVCGDRILGNRVPPIGSSGRAADTLLLAKGENTWSAFMPRGARHVMALARKAPESGVRIEDASFLRLRRERNEVSSFKCSDETLNRIWDVGVATLENTVGSILMSSPFPGRGQLLHAAMIQSLASFYVWCDFDSPAKALREFAASQFESGAMPVAAPSGTPKVCADLALLWPVWLDYFFTFSGDAEFAKELAPGIVSFIDFLERLTTDKLLRRGAMEACDCFIDREIEPKNAVTAVNALYCRSLLSAARLFGRAGNTVQMERCQRRAAEVAHRLKTLAYDPQAQLFTDNFLDEGGKATMSPHANILSLYAGVAGDNEFSFIFDKYFKGGVETTKCSPYFKFFLLETAILFGQREWALRHLKDYWGRMLDLGAETWWGSFDPSIDKALPDADLCDGAAVSPNIFLMRDLVGIRPASPEFAQVFIDPVLSVADWAKATLHTPKGKLKVSWELSNGQLKLGIDSTYRVDVIPLLPEEYADSCEFEISQGVSILAE